MEQVIPGMEAIKEWSDIQRKTSTGRTKRFSKARGERAAGWCASMPEDVYADDFICFSWKQENLVPVEPGMHQLHWPEVLSVFCSSSLGLLLRGLQRDP